MHDAELCPKRVPNYGDAILLSSTFCELGERHHTCQIAPTISFCHAGFMWRSEDCFDFSWAVPLNGVGYAGQCHTPAHLAASLDAHTSGEAAPNRAKKCRIRAY